MAPSAILYYKLINYLFFMKTLFKISIVFIFILLINSCKKEKDLPPLAVTLDATDITNLTATIKGNVNASNLATEVSFEFGSTTDYGQSITAVPSQISGEIVTSITANVTGLKSGEKYHYRIKATNTAGTVYGEDILFSTTVMDFEGNNYTTVKIGTQTWMVENLRSTKLNDGTLISNLTNATEWMNATSPAYRWYNNDVVNKPSYGALYNFYAMSNSKFCPAGWHVPNDAEWQTLIGFVGDVNTASNKLKEAGTAHWNTDFGATNESGFTALPGGYYWAGSYYTIRYGGLWWSTNSTTTSSSYLQLGSKCELITFNSKGYGFSVRCIRD
jgi:uncharacterized protein (TIGR02145 family)